MSDPRSADSPLEVLCAQFSEMYFSFSGFYLFCSVGRNLGYDITLMEWLKVSNSRYYCSLDSKAFSTVA